MLRRQVGGRYGSQTIEQGHVRAHHGQRAISQGYVARRHLAMPATTDYWVNDRAGEARIDAAVAAGSHETGIETVQAERLRVVETRVLHTDAKTGAETRFVRIERVVRNRPLSLEDACQLYAHHEPKALINGSSKRPALVIDAPS